MLVELVGLSITAILVIGGCIAVVLVIILALMYNTLVSKKNQVNNSFASVDVYLKKRYDLIPNLVSTVEGYMKHERTVLTEVTELRAKAFSGGVSDDEKVGLNNQLTSALRSIMVSVEHYPQLKANENFLKLQASLNDVEEQISAARRAYNASVLEYNNSVEMLPTNLMAHLIGYKRRNYFDIKEDERRVPDAPERFNKQ
ncbi:MAG: LemA family protein [Candidatus Altiarchaeota archaeon]